MKKLVIVFILINMSIHLISQEQKEDIYVFSFPSLTPARFPLTFILVDKDSVFVKSINFDVFFSYRKKRIKYIDKDTYRFENRYKYKELDNGNIWLLNQDTEKRVDIGDVEYFTTENFRKTTRYAAFKRYLPELLELDNYDLLLYLDNNFTKYYGAEEYRHAPLLKVQRE